MAGPIAGISSDSSPLKIKPVGGRRPRIIGYRLAVTPRVKIETALAPMWKLIA